MTYQRGTVMAEPTEHSGESPMNPTPRGASKGWTVATTWHREINYAVLSVRQAPNADGLSGGDWLWRADRWPDLHRHGSADSMRQAMIAAIAHTE